MLTIFHASIPFIYLHFRENVYLGLLCGFPVDYFVPGFFINSSLNLHAVSERGSLSPFTDAEVRQRKAESFASVCSTRVKTGFQDAEGFPLLIMSLPFSLPDLQPG